MLNLSRFCHDPRSAGEEEDRKLLPTEDSFLRLDDMERFVQDAEAADLRENARDTGEEDESVEGDDDDSGEHLSLRAPYIHNS